MKKRSPIWLLLYLVAFALNMRHVFGVFTQFGVFPRGTDSYYQMLRIQYLLDHSFRIPNIDYYINFPAGSTIYWPFGFTYIYAMFVELVTLGQPSEWSALALSSLLTPLVAALVPCLAYLIGIEMGHERVGLWAGLLLAILPVEFYTVGYIDHQVFEAFWPALYLLAYLRALNHDENNAFKARLAALIAGFAMTGGVLCTNALPIMIPIHGFLVLCQLARIRKDRELSYRVLSLNLFVCAGLLATLSPFAATRIAEPDGVNPALGLCWVAGFILFAATAGMLLHRSPRWMIIGSLVVTPLVLWRLDWPALIDFFIYGVSGFIFKADQFVAMIVEARPMLSFDRRLLLETYSGFLLLWPIAIVWMLRKGWRDSTAMWTVAVISVVTFLPAYSHFRFFTIFLLPYALTIGFLIHQMFSRLDRDASTRARALQLGCIAVLLLLLYPALASISFSPTIVMSGDNRFTSLHPTFLWIAEHTPATSPTGTAPGDYGIAAQWVVGNWILYYSKRPIVASPSGHLKEAREGIQAGAAMLMFPPERSLDLIRQRKIRYLLVSPMNVLGALQLAYDIGPNKPPPRNFDQASALNNSLFVQLLNNGVPGGGRYADVLRHFRLVHESPPDLKYMGYNHPYATLFEYVPGVEVFGKTQPNSKVTIEGKIRTANGREIAYSDSVMSDQAGGFTGVLPYASGKQRYSEVELVGPYKIGNANQTLEISVTEDDVLSGKRREVVF